MTQNLDEFYLCSEFSKFLTGPSSDHRADHLQKWPTHVWRALFILNTPDILSFRLNVLKIKFFDIEFHFFSSSKAFFY
jgi:hypothetical protein